MHISFYLVYPWRIFKSYNIKLTVSFATSLQVHSCVACDVSSSIMIQVLPSCFLGYESSWRYDIVVLTDDILIFSLLSRYNALVNVGGF